MHRARRVFVLFDILYSYFLGGSVRANDRTPAPDARHRPLGFGLRAP
jgi:hypothetical protein